ncbi:beta-galactosidase [Saccharothrix coeruleofusca]|uniref:beta-galactosidase n=1 Tax=Saccharothrix coeruleofusca TaxID=33919 RepID=UPI001AE3E6B7|nr:beta-galactosidase [Saccharothrix coeruleofusca]MBP2340708.1 beta-galactosidase [Saccharothrix coeruleofusca]
MTSWPTALPGLAWGADYNPEQWPEAVWRQDVELMRRAGVDLVTVGVFAWALLEVEEGRYEFGWLDRALDLLAEHGIRVDLATATAAPPPWLTTRYPDVLPERADGVRLSHGSRQAYCPTSRRYRDKAVALARALAERYRDHPALAAWHVGNEYGCHVPRCYCDRCGAAFREWLRARHGDLAALNESWGTAFWSQHYTDWAQVLPPRVTPSFGNPGQLLDFDRFCSDALLELFKAERDVLREVTPGVPVTTNFMVMWTFAELDYWAWAREVDFVSNDHYLRAEDPERHVELAFCADLVRGLAGGRPWLLMENSTSAVNWQPRNTAKPPGEMRRNAYAHLARGADGTLFFQWRQSVAGAERFHSAMVPHAGGDTRIFREVCQVGTEYARLKEIVGSTVDAEVALVYDWQSLWASRQPAHPTADFSYQDNALALYRALWRAGVTVDFVPPDAELSGYRLVVVPSLYLMDDAEPLASYAAGGGHLLVTYLSGIADRRDHVHPGGYPGALRELLGVRTEEFFPLRQGETVRLDDGGEVAVWTEWLHAESAEVVSRYADGPLAGVPAVTRHGDAWYLACGLRGEGLDALVAAVLDRAGVARGPEGVEAVRRRGALDGADVSWLVVVNHGERDAELPATGLELLSGARVGGQLRVPAGGVAVLREEV